MAKQHMNLAEWERWASIAAGTMLAAKALRRPSGFGAVFAGLGLALIGRGLDGSCPIYRGLGIATRREATRRRQDRSVDRASDDSFPASDPPAWTGTTVGGPNADR